MELKKRSRELGQVFAASLLVIAIAGGAIFLLRQAYTASVKHDPEQTVAYWKDRVRVFKEETDEAEDRAQAALIDELKARLAVASCEKRAAEWERRAREKGE